MLFTELATARLIQSSDELGLCAKILLNLRGSFASNSFPGDLERLCPPSYNTVGAWLQQLANSIPSTGEEEKAEGKENIRPKMHKSRSLNELPSMKTVKFKPHATTQYFDADV